MHWEGEKFDVAMTVRTKTAAVAAATAMRWGGAKVQARAKAANGPSCTQRSAWQSGKKGEEEVDDDNNVHPYFSNAREGVAWAMPLQTQAG
jgi:hypothetical protein